MLGWLARALTLCVVMGVCFGASIAFRNLFVPDVPDNFLIADFLIILVSMCVGLLLSEYPSGNEFAAMRLGFATFCRTGLPLLVVALVMRYSNSTFAGRAIGFLVAFYAVGLITSIGLSSYRFSSSSSNPKSHEVDSVPAS